MPNAPHDALISTLPPRAGAGGRARFDNSYARLPERFYATRELTPAPSPTLVKLNRALAEQLGLDADELASPEGIEVLAGSRVAAWSTPIAQAYAGHQFGSFNPQLGDGRAVLLAEAIAPDGSRFDIQLKGSGPTKFSRGGDGRAAIGPVLREYIISEAMAALGIPTTRSLAVIHTGDVVYRETILPGAVLTRIASSHIRVGTFQFFAARGDAEALRLLADHVIARHYPGCANAAEPYRALLGQVIARQADLVARWLLVGFIHGVMNTDNCSIAGETIDYGPCAFMDEYDPAKVFSSIDQMGRYAYANQPRLAAWNLARFAETLLPLLADDEDAAVAVAESELAAFKPSFDDAYLTGLRRKIGLASDEADDKKLADDFLTLMAQQGTDFTLAFRTLTHAANSDDTALHALFAEGAAIKTWCQNWRQRLERDAADPQSRAAIMRLANPAYIPRNHLVEEALAAASHKDDFNLFEELVAVLANPFDEQPGRERYAAPPLPEQRVQRTFCGT